MHEVNPKLFAFVLMPFSEEFIDIYEVGIKPACKDAGVYCERVDEQIFMENILERIYDQIAKADIVIAEMTGRNPNVFYEVGFAHALNKRVILLTQNSSDIPFDLTHYPHIIYSKKIAMLKSQLETKLNWCVENSNILSSPSRILLKSENDDQLLKGLRSLGIVRVYDKATEDNDYFDNHLQQARKIRILAVNIEMLIRNRPIPIKDALKKGAHLEILLATADSELVKEMERMEIIDGRNPLSRSIPVCIKQSEPELQNLYQRAFDELPNDSKQSLGKIFLAHFNTQYRETMIICDDDWVWWTPHLNPARGAERPTFVSEGNNAKLLRMCIKHFETVKKMYSLKQLSI